VGLILAVALLTAATLLLFQSSIPYLFTSDPELVAQVGNTLVYYVAYAFFDYMQGASAGIIRGMGKQFYASITNIISCFVIALPVGVFCAFSLGFGL
jgi:MATE family multidrug resistance protein